MKNRYLSQGCALALFSFGLAATAFGSSKSTVTTIGDDTYAVVRQANTGFTRDTATLKAAALDDAAKYCSAHGKQLKVLSAIEMKPIFMTADYARAKVVFKALDAGDPALKSEPPVAPAASLSSPVQPVAEGVKPSPTNDLYTELVKLDELRQRGILTEEEFQAEKKKVLRRSQ